MGNLRYAPEFRIAINDVPIPATLRSSITSVSYQTSLESADRVELTLINENLRWLDHPLLALDKTLSLSLGYAPDTLEQLFVGEITGQSSTFPGSGAPTLTIVAQDRRQRLQKGTKVRWFAVSRPPQGNFPMPDLTVASIVSAENGLIPIFDPVGAAISVLIGGAEVAIAKGNPLEMQKIIRKQIGESDYDFLRRIANENGWEMLIDHGGSSGGYNLRFMSLATHLTPDLTLKYGESLIEFTPRISTVGQVAGISVNIWQSDIKMEFTVTVSWDWDRNSLNLSISPGFGLPGDMSSTPEAIRAAAGQAKTPMAKQAALDQSLAAEKELATSSKKEAIMLLQEQVNQHTAPRVIFSKLITRLNQRLTGSGTTIGNSRILPFKVIRFEGVGEQFGGLYRVTSATHTINSSGYRTGFEVRKEIWFGSIPKQEQGAALVRLQR